MHELIDGWINELLRRMSGWMGMWVDVIMAG